MLQLRWEYSHAGGLTGLQGRFFDQLKQLHKLFQLIEEQFSKQNVIWDSLDELVSKQVPAQIYYINFNYLYISYLWCMSTALSPSSQQGFMLHIHSVCLMYALQSTVVVVECH